MSKIIEITHCTQCLNFMRPNTCLKVARVIQTHSFKIPKWCPLPNSPKNNKSEV